MPPSMPRPAASAAATPRGLRGPMRAAVALALAWLALTTASAALPARARAAELATLCEPGETVRFACRMARSGKTVSVCERPGHLAYRFGAPARLELALPDPKAPEPLWLLLEEGGNHELRGVVFPRGAHAYAVTRFVGGRPPTEELAISVQRNGSPVALLKCAQRPAPLGDLPALFEQLRAEGARLERR